MSQVLDEINEQQDHRLAKHLVSMHFENPPIHQSAKISSQKMRQFISYARQECHPRLSEEAAGELVKGYVEMRAQGAAAPSQR